METNTSTPVTESKPEAKPNGKDKAPGKAEPSPGSFSRVAKSKIADATRETGTARRAMSKLKARKAKSTLKVNLNPVAEQRIREQRGVQQVLHLRPQEVVVEKGFNPRIDFEAEALVPSIKANGVITPIQVKYGPKGGYVLVDGERRLRAAIKAQVATLPAIVVAVKDDKDAMVRAVIANDGKPLLPVEEAQAYQKLLALGMSLKEIAHRCGRPLARVKHRLDLISAHPDVVEAVKKGKISVHLGVDIARKAKGNEHKQQKLVKKASTSSKGRKKVEILVGRKDVLSMVDATRDSLIERKDVLLARHNERNDEKLPKEVKALMLLFNKGNLHQRLAFVVGGIHALSLVYAAKKHRGAAHKSKGKKATK